MTATGRLLLYSFGRRLAKSELVWRGRDGRIMGREGGPAGYFQVFLSPDGSRAALNMTNRYRLWVLQLTDHTMSPVESEGRVLDGVWSPDSRRLVFQIYGPQKTQILMQTLGETSPKLLLDDGNSNYPDAWSPDGKWILCRRNTNTVFIIPPDGNAAPKVLLETNHLMDEFQFSPDGKWVAYNSDESGRWEVYAARFPEMDRVLKLSDQGGCQPIWRQDGGELFYLTPEAKLMSVPLKQGSVLQPGAPRLLFQSDVLPVNCIISQYAAANGAGRFLMVESRPGDEIELADRLHVVTNWAAAMPSARTR